MNMELMQQLKYRHGLQPLIPTKKGMRADIGSMSYHPKDLRELERFRLQPSRDGRLLESNGMILATPQKGIVGYENSKVTGQKRVEYKILAHENGNLYGVPEKAEGKNFKHSSLMGADWPLMAGTLETDPNGLITELTNRSGHFVPGPNVQNALLEYMEHSGVRLDQLNHNNNKHILNEEKTAQKLIGREGRIGNTESMNPMNYRAKVAYDAGMLLMRNSQEISGAGAAASAATNRARIGDNPKAKPRSHSW